MSTAVVDEAARLLRIVTQDSMVDMEELDDADFQRLAKMGTKSLYIACMAKAWEAVQSIDMESLSKISPVAAATVAGILVDKAAGPLTQMANVSRDDEKAITFEDVQALLGSVRARVKTLEGAGFKIKFEDPTVPIEVAVEMAEEVQDDEPPSASAPEDMLDNSAS